jgi:hypothetical protein
MPYIKHKRLEQNITNKVLDVFWVEGCPLKISSKAIKTLSRFGIRQTTIEYILREHRHYLECKYFGVFTRYCNYQEKKHGY